MQPNYDQQSPPTGTPEIALPVPEQGLTGYDAVPAAPELAPVPPQGASVAAQPVAPVATPTVTTPPTATASAMPSMADDADLIEKEWVAKAKQIINQTKEDPYTQSKELGKVRVEYIKKRYNKDMKLPEQG